MQSRRSINQPPQLVFTKDFHQLVQGSPSQGACEIRYDPLRLLPREDFTAPRPITLHAILYPNGPTVEYQLTFPADSVLQYHLADLAGQSLMLTTKISTPVALEELEIWFSYQDQSGITHCDSGFGRNYWLRFPLRDIKQITANIKTETKSTEEFPAKFSLQIATVPEVTAITARWRIPTTNNPLKRYETPLSRKTKQDDATSSNWQFDHDQSLPKDATAVFDLVYTIAGRTYTDDNEGSYYLADLLVPAV